MAIALLLAALTAAACGGGYNYFSSAAANAYFRMPAGWTKFTQGQIFANTGQSQSASEKSSVRFLMGFDGSPRPSVEHVLNLTPKVATPYPIAVVQVRRLTEDDADAFSYAQIRNSVFPIDNLIKNAQSAFQAPVDVLSYTTTTTPPGYYGSTMTYDLTYNPGQGFTGAGNDVLRYTQIGLYNPDADLFYLLLVGCSATCYEHNQAAIGQVIHSWTVKER